MTVHSRRINTGIYRIEATRPDGETTTFRIERTMNADGTQTSEGWHLYQEHADGTESYWNTFPTKRDAMLAIEWYAHPL